jgi:hypothetical protein
MTNYNPLPYECVPVPGSEPTTPDIWGVYPENAMLRAQIEKNEEYQDFLLKEMANQLHEIRTLNDRIGFNDVMHKSQFHAINTFFKWVMDHYDIDKQDDIWEMLDGMFQDGLLTDPRKRTYRIRVTKKEIDEYDVELPWDMTEERAGDILRSNILNGEFTRNNFQDVTELNDTPVTVVAHSNLETEWNVWNRGQVNQLDSSPW